MGRKKILIIIIVILLAVFIILAVYNFFLRDERPAPVALDSFFASPEDLGATSLRQQNSNGVLFRLNAEVVGDYFISNKEEVIAVLANGLVQRFGRGGDLREEKEFVPISNLLMIKINPLGVQVSAKNLDGQWLLFTPDNQQLESLSPAVTGVAFSPQGQMAIVEEDPSTALGASEASSRVIIRNGGSSRTVFDGKIPDLEASWVNEKIIALSTTPSGVAPGILYLLDVGSKRITPILGNRYGLTALVSPNAKWVLFSETGSNGRQLILKSLEASSGQEQVLGFNTLPEKCVASQINSDVVYCAVFSASPQTNIMPDDYRKDIFQNTKSDVVRFNFETGETKILHQDLPVDPVLPKLSADEQFLFFINKRDGSLMRLAL